MKIYSLNMYWCRDIDAGEHDVCLDATDYKTEILGYYSTPILALNKLNSIDVNGEEFSKSHVYASYHMGYRDAYDPINTVLGAAPVDSMYVRSFKDECGEFVQLWIMAINVEEE